jgi:hypothetical protein
MGRATQELALERVLRDFISTLDPSQHTFELPDDVLVAMVELESLHDDSSGSAEPTAPIFAPRKPNPHLNSGVIALPEADVRLWNCISRARPDVE